MKVFKDYNSKNYTEQHTTKLKHYRTPGSTSHEGMEARGASLNNFDSLSTNAGDVLNRGQWDDNTRACVLWQWVTMQLRLLASNSRK